MNQTRKRRFGACLSVATLATMGVLSTASMASADDGPDTPGARETGSLTVHKLSSMHTPLSGVGFTIEQVGREADGACKAIDLKNSADWEGLDGLKSDAPATPFCLVGETTQKTVETDANGDAKFEGLPLSVYYVQETNPPKEAAAAPSFYASIPMRDGNGWTYDVVASPKNVLNADRPTKTATTDADGNPTYTITSQIPNVEKFTSASITDKLPEALKYVSATVKAGDTELAEKTHYTVTNTDGVKITLTEAGLEKLSTQQGKTLTVTLKTTVDDTANLAGAIVNNDYGVEFNGTPSKGSSDDGDTPHTYFGKLKVEKVDSADNNVKLAGANFALIAAPQNGECPAPAPSKSLMTGTSNKEGLVEWANQNRSTTPRLVVAEQQGSAADASKSFCLYETKAPAGYTASTTPTKITVEVGKTADQVVENAARNTPNLPLTGAQGAIILTLCGLTLVLVGGGVAYTTRRRNQLAE